MANNQQKIGVTLAFQADTRAAKQQIDNLQTALNKVMLTTSRTSGQLALTKELTEASAAAAQLKTHIQNAMNTNTGKLDLSKFNQSLKQSGMSINQYRQALSQAGSAGQRAFNQLAISITTAEVPLVRISSSLRKLGITLANTARWQISSSLLMGFTGAISNAYNYAQDLNESLNNIRIVTGYNIEQMDKFAAAATKAAKALSTTTTKYTDASLIYFQQGLNDQQVQQRTDLTIKMANVTGESVSKVSDQLTAIWNNFDNGTQSLEHYVDVMVALGAATASSTDEISEGLNKFAAIAETVGLSYEYAASALATVTATTRQSADIVGTAFKTLFARIQDLELGKTLDDGTTLGQYSQALASVGINIKDANGQVRDMNSILDEMGAKWDSLNKAQQIALAQNVAGVRQYTQLIALMDKWDYFQENLATANTSAGALSEQAEIYAESWQAARDRVTASLEDIYNKLLEDDAFIEILNFFEKFLKQISNTIDSLGGLQGVLTTIGTVLLNVFSQQIAQGMTNLSFSIKTLTKSGRQELLQLQQDAAKEMAASYGKTGLSALQGQAAASMSTAQQHYAREAASMNDTQKEIAQHILAQQQGLAEAAMNQAEYTKEAEKTAKVLANAARADMRQNGKETTDITEFNNKLNQAKSYGAANTIASGLQKFDEGVVATDVMKDASVIVEDLQAHLTSLGITSKEIPSTMSQMIKSIDGAEDAFKAYATAVETADAALKGKDEAAKVAAIDALIKAEQNLNSVIGSGIVSTKNMSKAQREAIDAAQGAGIAYGRTAIKAAEAAVNVERLPEAMRKATTQTRALSQDIVAFAQGLGSVAAAANSVKGIIDVLNNEDMTFWEKLLSITTSLSMAIPMLITGMKALSGIELTNTIGKIANAAATWEQVRAENALQKETGESIVEKGKQTLVDGVNTIGKKANSIKDAWNKNALQSSSRFKFNEKMGGTGRWVDTSAGNKMVSESYAASEAGKTALKNVGTKLAGGLATAAVVAVALAAAKGIYDAADEAYNRDANAAKDAEALAERMAKAYEEVNAEYNELKSSIDSYYSQINSLEELEKDTLEYKDTIASANEQALKLINTYGLLADAYETTAEGLIVINEESIRQIQIDELRNKNAAQMAATLANREAREARQKSSTTNFLREDLQGSNAEWTQEDASITGKAAGIGGAVGTLTGAAIGMKIGGTVGSFIPVPVVGTLIGIAAGALLGAGIGAIISGFDDEEATSQERTAIEALTEAYEEMGNAALTPENIAKALHMKGITDPELIASLSENKEKLQELIEAEIANTEAIKAENVNLARQQLSTIDSSYDNYSSLMASALANVTADRMAVKGEQLDYNRSRYTTENLWGAWYSATTTGEDIAKQWAKAQGLENFKTTNFSDDTIEYEYYNKDTKKTEKAELDYDDLAAWEKGRDLSADVAKNYETIRNTVWEMSKADPTDGMLALISEGDLSSLSFTEVQKFKEAYESGQLDEQLRALGEQTGQHYSEAVAKAINEWNYDESLAKYTKKTQAEIDSILTAGSEETGISAKALENYSKVIVKNSEVLSAWGDEWQRLDNEKFAAEIAVSNAKFAKGIVALNEVISENIDTLYEWNEQSLDTWQAVAQVQESLTDVLGLEVSSDFVQKHLKEIKALADGDVSSLEALRQEAAKDYILNLDISDEGKRNFESLIDSLINQAENKAKGIEIGATIDDSSYLEQLNKMLEAGDIAADEVKKTFAAIGYAVDIRTTKKKVENTSKFSMTDPNTGKTWSGSITNTSYMDVPYIAGEGTESAGEKFTTSSGEEMYEGAKENGDGFTFTGGSGDLSGLLNEQQEKTGKNKKRMIDEIGRYHEIKEKLSDVERELNKISKAKERAFGQRKLALMEQEIKKQEELIQAEKQYQKDLQDQYNDDLLKLDSRFELDENGRIKNYTDVLKDLINNGITGDPYEEIKKSADQYEETLNELEAQQEVVNDSIDKAVDLALEKIEYSVEIKVHFNDRDIKHFNFLLEKLDDPLQDAAEAIARIGKTAASNLSNIDAYIGGIEEILGQSFSDSQSKAFQNLLSNMPSAEALPSALSEILGDAEFTDDQVTALEKYMDSLYDTSGALDDFYTQVMEQVNGAFDDMNEKSEKAISRTEQLGETLQTYQNIIDLVGKKALGVTNEQIRALGRAQIAQAKATLETKQGQLEMNRTALAAAEAKKKAAEESGDSEAVKYWEEQIETIQDKVWTLEGEVETAWSDTLQSIADDFQNAVGTATSAFEESMTGIYGSYEKMQEAFDQQKEIGDRYVEDYKKIYELSKLNRDLNKSIDSTDSIKGKQALRDLQEEINALQESDAEMSEYDLEYLRKKYELRVAEIALEEAQNAKSQVRMQRDAEGNWGYVYTADEAKIDSSQQNYEDKLYAMQEFNQAYMDEVQSAIIQTEADMLAAIEQLHEEDYASQEEYFKAVDEVRKYYTDKRNYYFSELQKSIGNNKTLYNEDWQSYSDNTGYKISKAGEWKDSFEETEYALVTKYPDIETAQRTFTENSKRLVDDLTGAYDQWQKDVSEAFDLVGKDFENFAKEGGELDQRTKEVEGKLATVTSEFNSWKPTAEGAFQGIIDAAEDKFTDFSSKINDYQSKIKNVTDALREMLRLAGEKIPDKELDTSTDGVKGNTTGGSIIPSTIPGKTPTTTKQNYYGTKTYSLKGEKVDDRTQEVLEKGAFQFTKEELASAKRSTPWSSYFDIIKDGYTYSIAESDYLPALTESGQSDLYKAAEKNPFRENRFLQINDRVKLKPRSSNDTPYYSYYNNTMTAASDLGVHTDNWNYEAEEYDMHNRVAKVHLIDNVRYIGINNRGTLMYFKESDVMQYDTGGYTGSWDPSGRLAMLHQKEIVLNAHDTENFLAAINIVRDIASAIDLRAAAQQSALSQITAASVSPTMQTLEQEVTIHAEFPNATQRTEIEAAFDTLLNRASQFANRKNK